MTAKPASKTGNGNYWLTIGIADLGNAFCCIGEGTGKSN
jgi:hypothetical protein